MCTKWHGGHIIHSVFSLFSASLSPSPYDMHVAYTEGLISLHGGVSLFTYELHCWSTSRLRAEQRPTVRTLKNLIICSCYICRNSPRNTVINTLYRKPVTSYLYNNRFLSAVWSVDVLVVVFIRWLGSKLITIPINHCSLTHCLSPYMFRQIFAVFLGVTNTTNICGGITFNRFYPKVPSVWKLSNTSEWWFKFGFVWYLQARTPTVCEEFHG